MEIYIVATTKLTDVSVFAKQVDLTIETNCGWEGVGLGDYGQPLTGSTVYG